MKFDSAFSTLSDESKFAFERISTQEAPDRDTISALNGLVRASLIAGPHPPIGEPIGQVTDCVGATTILGTLCRELGYNASRALVKAYPWQNRDNQREIHVVSIIGTPDGDEQYYADPMPLTGYFFGTSGPVEQTARPRNLETFDEVLGGTTTLDVLTDEEVQAIQEVQGSARLNDAELVERKEALEAALPFLGNAGSYAMRDYVLLDKINGDIDHTLLNSNLIPAAVRSSQVALIKDRDTVEAVQQLYAQDTRAQALLASMAERAIAISNNAYDANYWSSVEKTFRHGYRVIYEDPLTKINWRHFLDLGTSTPISDYERYMLSQPTTGLCKSELYKKPL